ncbi:MAG: hypothetical protein ABIK44_05615, partial [candidate division WOR-3 bacterium]
MGVRFQVKLPAPYAGLGRKGRNIILWRWFPQVAAYDYYGWHVDGFHPFGYSPGAFADYDVAITLPSDLGVAATGIALDSLTPQPSDSLFITRRFRASAVPDFACFITDEPRRILGCPPARMIAFYSARFGPGPSQSPTVIDASGIITRSISAPGLILLAEKP